MGLIARGSTWNRRDIGDENDSVYMYKREKLQQKYDGRHRLALLSTRSLLYEHAFYKGLYIYMSSRLLRSHIHNTHKSSPMSCRTT